MAVSVLTLSFFCFPFGLCGYEHLPRKAGPPAQYPTLSHRTPPFNIAKTAPAIRVFALTCLPMQRPKIPPAEWKKIFAVFHSKTK